MLLSACQGLALMPYVSSAPLASVLDKKSTALDVIKHLKSTSKLASYVNMTETILDCKPVAVVTGGSSGIGIPCVEALAVSNMKVVLCARNLNAAQEVVQSMPPSIRDNIRIQKLDLSNMKSIQEATEDILAKESRIDVILLNAGVMSPPKRMTTANNLELQFGTNHVGHHMFARYLLPKLNAEGRVVTVASDAHSFGQLNFANLNYDPLSKEERNYSAWGAYGQSKLANILFAKGLSDELKELNSNIKSISLHPGVIGTNLWRYTPSIVRPFLNMLITDKSSEQGAATSVYGCLVDTETFEGGEYLRDCAIVETLNQYAKDELKTLRKKLWVATETIIKQNGFHLPSSLI
jgi:WW domain-containing oxidoreductase